MVYELVRRHLLELLCAIIIGPAEIGTRVKIVTNASIRSRMSMSSLSIFGGRFRLGHLINVDSRQNWVKGLQPTRFDMPGCHPIIFRSKIYYLSFFRNQC